MSSLPKNKLGLLIIAAVLLLSLPGFIYVATIQQDIRIQAAKKDLTCSPGRESSAANTVRTASSVEIARELKKSHDSLEKLMSEYRRIGGTSNSSLKNRIRDTANKRKLLLVETMRRNPKEALTLLERNKNLEKDLTTATVNCTAHHTIAEGTLNTAIADFISDDTKKSSSIVSYTLEEKGSRKTRYIHTVNSLVDGLRSGTKVKITGYMLDSDMLVDTRKTDTIKVTAEPNLAKGALGEQKTAVILVNMNNSGVSVSKNQMNDFVFGTMDDYYQEVSYGKTSFTGTVYGPYAVNASAACDDVVWVPFAKNAIIQTADKDIDYSDVQRVLVVGNFNCQWSGVAANVGIGEYQTDDGSVSMSVAFVKPQYATGWVTVHEIGHTLGVFHAGFLSCGSNALCNPVKNETFIEYGNPYNVMGDIGNMGHMDAAHKEYLGWLDSSNITTVNKSGSYKISPIESEGENTVALKIPRSSDSSLYVEYRQPIGFDKTFKTKQGSSIDQVYNGVLLHLINRSYLERSGFLQTMLFDPGPPSDATRSTLNEGESFTDPESETVIKVSDITNDTVTLDIEYRGPEVSPDPDEPEDDFTPTPDPCTLTPTPGQDGPCVIHDPTGRTREGYQWSNVNRWNDEILRAVDEVSRVNKNGVDLRGIRVPADRIKAHIMIESQGNPNAHQRNPLGDAYGLMQVTENAASYPLLTSDQKAKLKAFDPYASIYAGTLELAYRYQTPEGRRNWDRASAGYFSGNYDGDGICDPVNGNCPNDYRGYLTNYLEVLDDSECSFRNDEKSEDPTPTDAPDNPDEKPDKDNPDSNERNRDRDPNRNQKPDKNNTDEKPLRDRILERVQKLLRRPTLAVPTPNVKRPNIPTPRPPLFDFPDWFPFNRNKEETPQDLGEKIEQDVQNKINKNRNNQQDLGNQIENKVKSRIQTQSVTSGNPCDPEDTPTPTDNPKEDSEEQSVEKSSMQNSRLSGNVTRSVTDRNNSQSVRVQNVNLLIYNDIIDCYSDVTPPRACSNEKKAQADLNSDGSVNQLDYNIFLNRIRTLRPS